MKSKTLTALFVTVCLTGCIGTMAAQAEDAQKMKLVTDGAGNEIEVPEEIERYAVSAGPYCMVTWCVDGGNSERMVAMQGGNYFPGNAAFFDKNDPDFAVAASNPGIGMDCSVNVEELMNLDPDVVFLWDTQTAEAEKLKEVGIIPVMVSSSAQSYDDFSDQITMIGEVLGREDQAAKLVSKFTETKDYFESRADEIAETDKTSFLYLQTSGLSVASSLTPFTDFMNRCGGVNVTTETEGGAGLGYWTTVDMEQIMTWDPEVIVLSNFDAFTPEDLYENKIEGQDWSNISAVKNHRVYKEGTDITWLCISYSEMPLYLEWMAKLVQPELYQDLDLAQEWKDYYKEMFDIELTDEDISNIMNVSLNGDDML